MEGLYNGGSAPHTPVFSYIVLRSMSVAVKLLSARQMFLRRYCWA